MKFRKFDYMLSLLFVFTIPAFVESLFLRDIDYANVAFFAIGICIVGSLWDIWATRHGRRDAVWLWQFNRKNTLGLYFFDLPIEEYVFYLSASTYIIFTWELLDHANAVGDLSVMHLLISLMIWSLFFILFPYIFKPRNDKTT